MPSINVFLEVRRGILNLTFRRRPMLRGLGKKEKVSAKCGRLLMGMGRFPTSFFNILLNPLSHHEFIVSQVH